MVVRMGRALATRVQPSAAAAIVAVLALCGWTATAWVRTACWTSHWPRSTWRTPRRWAARQCPCHRCQATAVAATAARGDTAAITAVTGGAATIVGDATAASLAVAGTDAAVTSGRVIRHIDDWRECCPGSGVS